MNIHLRPVTRETMLAEAINRVFPLLTNREFGDLPVEWFVFDLVNSRPYCFKYIRDEFRQIAKGAE